MEGEVVKQSRAGKVKGVRRDGAKESKRSDEYIGIAPLASRENTPYRIYPST